jgi:anti-sigma factor RsiW
MNCRAAEELIQRSLDAALSSQERARLEMHLADCPACRQAQSQYRRLSQAAEDWARCPAPSEMSAGEFTAQVMARLAAAPAPRFLWPRLLAAGMVLLFAAALSPVAASLLPVLPAWHPAWTMPSLDLWLRGWGDGLRAAPQEASGLWAATGGLVASPWAALLLAVALPVNALLCLRARRGTRSAA